MGTKKKKEEEDGSCEEKEKRKERKKKERWGRNEMNGLKISTYIQRRVLNYELPKLPL